MEPDQIVRDFIAAIEAKDIDAAMERVAENISYENMPIDPVVGRDAVRATLTMFLEPASEVDWPVLRQVVDGNCVINERLDRFKIGNGWLELAVVGVFEVENDLITLWRDYFDMASYQRQMGALTTDD